MSKKRSYLDVQSMKLLRKNPKRKIVLPIDGVKLQLAYAIKNNSVVIIVGETGSGKSTRVPQICYEHGLIENGILAITQPRRVAAITLARRVAYEMESDLGEMVAYKVRFENTESEDTRILYATDGIILREAFYDSLLSRYSLIIIDEAHERSVHTDILFYILRLCYKQRKDTDNPLKLIIMSATLETDILSEYYYNAPVYMVQGRTHSVELFYANSLNRSDDDYVFNALATVMQIHQTEPISSHILVFLTGQEEIETACKKAAEAARLVAENLVAIPLYAGLSPGAQMRAFEPLKIPNARKVIFSTNIAETSLTIPGIRIVVDSGKIKIKRYMPERGIDVLKVENISQSSATQRAGRAGREAPGKCYRLYSEKHFQILEKNSTPEILRANLSTVLLELYRIGLKKIQSLSLLSEPPRKSLEIAQIHLRLLNAITEADERGRIHLTSIGNNLAAFPIDPFFALVLIEAARLGCLDEALTVVASMSADNIFIGSSTEREKSNTARRKFEAAEGDHCTMINIFRGFRTAKIAKKLKEWCQANYLHERVLVQVAKIRQQLRDICLKLGMNSSSCGTDRTKLRKALGIGLFMNVCEYDRSKNCYRLVMSPHTLLKIHPSSCLSRSRPSAFVFTDLIKTNELYARDVTVIDIDWVRELINTKRKLLKKLTAENDVK